MQSRWPLAPHRQAFLDPYLGGRHFTGSGQGRTHKQKGFSKTQKTYLIHGNVQAPKDFHEWPVVAVKVDGKWEIHERRSDWPVFVKIGGVNAYRFKNAEVAAMACCRVAIERGFPVCEEGTAHRSQRFSVGFVPGDFGL